LIHNSNRINHTGNFFGERLGAGADHHSAQARAQLIGKLSSRARQSLTTAVVSGTTEKTDNNFAHLVAEAIRRN
jgi:hypothetical protein